ncbi:hypothetical protein [Reyranella sp.]|uniref:hypothetical protein n=1 Tax=Reyranella sp. TaxID=1929291 RepID=UPI003BABCB56
MPPYPTDAKAKLCRRFLAALEALDAAGREPDRWEEECLAYALGAMACGMYLVAEVELEAFQRAPSERSPDEVAALIAKPRRFTKDMLRAGLEYTQARFGKAGSASPDIPAALTAASVDLQSSLPVTA